MPEVMLRGKRLRLDPRSAIGKGGEADVYAIDGGRALKVFKDAAHPDYQGLPGEQAAARERLALYQRKLPLFPLPLPSRVVQPEDLATLPGGEVAGYAMRRIDGALPLARYGDRSYREARTRDEDVVALFTDLHATVAATHRAGVVIGDFNDLNVLMREGGPGGGPEAYLIDADSYGVGAFPCRVFTPRFTDPTLCVAQGADLVLARPCGTDADWYAFAVLLMQSLLFVDPYGGVYRPSHAGSGGGRPLSAAGRMLQRITVFHPDVRYPRPARPYAVLPDELLAHFEDTFVRDRRGPFPPRLLHELRWTRCPSCGSAHARPSCPTCRHVVAAPLLVRHGAARRELVFETDGHIVRAALQGDILRLAARTATGLVREDGRSIVDAGWPARARVLVQGERTVVAADGLALTYGASGTGGSSAVALERLAVDGGDGATPLIEATATAHYWVGGGTLWRDGRHGPERIGDVIPETTRFWVGSTFGLGFYRAGTLARAFVFDALHGGLNDGVPLTLPAGHLVDACCTFAEGRAWLFLTETSGGRTTQRCVVIGRTGGVEAEVTAPVGDGSWLDLGGAAGVGAVGSALFVPTDAGVVRVELTASHIAQTRAFPDTEPFVDSATRLFPGPGGLYAVGSRRADLLLLS